MELLDREYLQIPVELGLTRADFWALCSIKACQKGHSNSGKLFAITCYSFDTESVNCVSVKKIVEGGIGVDCALAACLEHCGTCGSKNSMLPNPSGIE